MEAFAKQLPIAELIAELDSHMVSIGYAASTMGNFRKFWRALRRHAEKDGVEYLSKDVGFALLKEHYGIDPYALHLGEYHSSIRRAMMLLLEFQISGCIAGGIQRSVYILPAVYESICEQYFHYLKTEKLLKDSTIHNHRKIITQALCFFDGHNIQSLTQIGTPEIEQYLLTMVGLSKSYISSIINSLRRFFEYALKHGFTDKQVIFPRITVYKDRKIPEYYTAEEVRKILASIDRANPCGKRDYAMILFGARYGLRIGDIRKLKLSDISFTDNTISIIQQKTEVQLTHPLLQDVGWALIDYLRYGRPESNSQYVFLRHVPPYEKLGDNDNMEYMIRKYANAAGVLKSGNHHKCGFHMLRYSLASDLLANNVSLSTISSILGHSEMNITAKYTQLNTNQLLECALEVPV